ncbi:hypothetical protein OG205_12180 [Lentzea sp. NBC_00516]|uniref:hypothetical protein n=1 Tax=Lentzea sp. NBC_00516 TaxID=2903582 RepID=UPI002E81355A|nr:hypothetical protein [Lentzea sp. NBC_00516]WUD27716.1 hypothetical protein OG205_12180 [Lentzea sp. NBC_00516]
MTPDPVVVDAADGLMPRACALADVIRTSSPGVNLGWALGVFAQLPGLTLVVVELPTGDSVFVGRRGRVCTGRTRAGLVKDVYRWWVGAGQSSALSRCRAMPALDEPSERNASSADWN